MTERIKILLIHAPKAVKDEYDARIPLGLLYLASSADRAGYRVDFIDGYIKGHQAIIDKAKEFQPQVVGVTCLTAGRKSVLRVAFDVKQISPNTRVVLGGAHATVMAEQILKYYPAVDYIVRGAGEITLVELLDAVFKQNKNLADIKGIAFRDKEQIVLTPYRGPLPDLDALPFPKWDLIDFEEYHKYDGTKMNLGTVVNGVNLKENARVPLVFSRGCSGSCTFCLEWRLWQGWHCRSPKNFVDEIEYLYREKNMRHFIVLDDNFITDAKKVDEICDEILKRNLKIAFQATARVDRVSEALLRKLKQAGCYSLSYGIESGSEKILKTINKRVSLEDSYRAIQLTKEAGILATAFMMVGNPGETFQTINESIDFLRKANPNIISSEHTVWLHPGTALYNSCKQKGLVDDSVWLGDKPHISYLAEHSKLELRIFEIAIRLKKKLSPHKLVNFFTHYLFFFLRNKIQGIKQRINQIIYERNQDIAN